jgi:hypothetical protein
MFNKGNYYFDSAKIFEVRKDELDSSLLRVFKEEVTRVFVQGVA